MMRYYQSRERIEALRASAQSWLGTPFAPRSMVKGAGVDCAHLAAALYIETGLWKEFNPGRYTMDGGRYLKSSEVERYARECGTFEEHQGDGFTPLPGDLLTFMVGRVTHHVGMLIEGTQFLHSFQGGNVRFNDLRDSSWLSRLDKIFVPIETL